MKKQILAIAIAAGLTAAPFMANAEANVYGRIHVSLDNIETGGGTASGGADAELDFKDRKSAFGVKGKEDLGGGMSALYKVEWSFDPADGGAIGTRDRWVGLKKAGMGTMLLGTVTSNYKETAAKMDPFWHTAVEGRGTNAYSPLSNGTGDSFGRMTNALQLHSAPMGGIKAVINLQMNNSGEMTTGFGLRYEAKGLYAFADMLNLENDTNNDGMADDTQTGASPVNWGADTATKFGAKYTMDALTAGVTIEQSEDVVGFDYVTLMATYSLNENDTVALTYGQASHITTAALDTDTLAVGYMHSMSKSTAVYAAYGDKSSDTVGSELNGLSFGLKHSF